MKLFLTFLLVSFSNIDPTEIAKVNALKEEAESAYLAGNYEKSAAKYSYLLDTLNISDESATLNLAHAYYKLKDTENALNNYQKLIDAKNSSVKSLAFQQLGVLSNDPKTLKNALSYFKEAIKSDPSNDDARYNYELLKKKLIEQQENQDKDQDNQDQEDQEDKENKDQEDKEGQDDKQEQKENEEKQDKEGESQEQEQKEEENKESEEGDQSEEEQKQKQDKEGEESDEEKEKQQQEKEGEESEEEKNKQNQPPSTSDKLKEMNISEEKAKMILEALRNNEVQYIQQNRRKATKKKDNDKPDW